MNNVVIDQYSRSAMGLTIFGEVVGGINVVIYDFERFSRVLLSRKKSALIFDKSALSSLILYIIPLQLK